MYQAWRRYHHGILQSGPGFIVPDVAPPSFPQTSILDNFNRANEGPPPSANWTTGIDGSTDGISVTSNEARRDTGGTISSAWWNVGNVGPNLEVFATMGTVKGPWRLHFRTQQEGTAGWDGYMLLAYTPTNELYVYRVDNGVQTQLGTAIAQTINSGDSFGASMIGDSIQVYYKTAAGSWAAVGTPRTDATYASAGKLAISAFDAIGINMDDFGGGTI